MSPVSQNRSILQILVLGKIRFPQENTYQLTVVGSYTNNRAVQRIDLTSEQFTSLDASVNRVRAFIESGTPTLERADFENLGSALFDFLFPDRIRALFTLATGAHSDQPLLPFEITCEDPRLAAWPWEYVYNTLQPQFLCAEGHPVSRGVITLNRHTPRIEPAGKIKLLFALGVPPTDSRITPREEEQVLYDVFRAYLADGSFELKCIELKDVDRIEDQLDRNPCDILHFFGHAGFDINAKTGYLRIERPGGKAFRLNSELLGQMLLGRGIRLVFLNACRSALSSSQLDPAQSSVAGGLHGRGIPTVVGTQFSMPDKGSHFFSAQFYNVLSTGKSIVEAMLRARRTMNYSDDRQFFDWGIPVVYCADPCATIFPLRQKARWENAFERDHRTVMSALTDHAFEAGPSVTAPNASPNQKRATARCRVGLVDIDSNVGFLPELVKAANESQEYYSFRLIYLPPPSGYARFDLGLPQTFVPVLADLFEKRRVELGEHFLCCLTKNLIAGEGYSNFFASAEESGGRVSFISTFDLRKYAEESGRSFAMACLSLCLSMLLMGDARWNIRPHEKTYGCFFDFCSRRDDIVTWLRKLQFDHKPCRGRIRDNDQLRAIDSLLRIEVPDPRSGQNSKGKRMRTPAG
jgi:hypothetical protein